MAALTARHFKIAMLLVSRRNRETGGCPEAGALHAWHMIIAGERVLWHIQPASDKSRQCPAERVPDVRGVALAPVACCDAARLTSHVPGHAPCAIVEQFVPSAVQGWQQVRRTLLDQGPYGIFGPIQVWERKGRMAASDGSGKTIEHAMQYFLAERAHQSVPYRLGGGMTVPVAECLPHRGARFSFAAIH